MWRLIGDTNGLEAYEKVSAKRFLSGDYLVKAIFRTSKFLLTHRACNSGKLDNNKATDS